MCIKDLFDDALTSEFASELWIDADADLEQVANDNKILSALWALMIHTCGSLACLHGHYQQILSTFVELLQPEPDAALADLEKAFDAISVLEAIAAEDQGAAQVLQEVGVADLHWCKAMLLNLWEHGFREASTFKKQQPRCTRHCPLHVGA
jgi:non-ribosomal peptide synthetase component E (peptide arylation enzyme)